MAPKPSSEASVYNLKGNEKFGNAVTGSDVNNDFKVSKAFLYSGDHANSTLSHVR